MAKHILIIGGIAILVLAVIDALGVSLEIPTSSTTTNMLIGGGMIAAPYLYGKYL